MTKTASLEEALTQLMMEKQQLMAEYAKMAIHSGEAGCN